MRRAARLGGLFLLLATVTVGADPLDGRVYRVVDGDTLMVVDGSHSQREIRLLGIDAPWVTQAFGQNARTALSALAANQALSAECRKFGAQNVCRVRMRAAMPASKMALTTTGGILCAQRVFPRCSRSARTRSGCNGDNHGLADRARHGDDDCSGNAGERCRQHDSNRRLELGGAHAV